MNIQRSERVLETIPVGSLGIIPLPSCRELGQKINDYLVQWRRESINEHKNTIAFQGYERDSYLISVKVPRFGSERPKASCRNRSGAGTCISWWMYAITA